MPAARKSAVSATSNWFRRDPNPSLGKRRSANRQSATSQASTESLPVSTNRQRRSSKKLSVSATNGSVLRPLVPSGTQSSAKLQGKSRNGQKSPKLGFLSFSTQDNTGTLPLWLLRFSTFHRYSSVVAFLLVAATLVVYGWTVYSQEIWSQGYRKLQNLQRHERQLKTTNAALTNKMAQEAEQPTAGLALPTPSRTIFLPPASHSPNSTPTQTTPNPETQPPISSPLGY